jgi:hypothetical protein
MALDAQQALKWANDVLRQSYTPRAEFESRCALHLTYIYGNHWSRIAGERRTTVDGISRLRAQMRSLDREVRMVMPKILARIEKLTSKLAVKNLDYRVDAQSGAANDFMAAQVGTERLRLFCDDVRAMRAMNLANWWRCAMGSVVLRRTMVPLSEGVTLRDVAGQPLGEPGRPKKIRSYGYGWSIVPPFEIIRDPSARSQDFDEEDIIGQEKPRTLAWLQRNFPGVTLPDQASATTMGQLLQFQRFTYRATGANLGYDFALSEAPAVMFSEWWFEDQDASEAKWPYHMLAYRTCSGSGGEQGLQLLTFGRNPYHRLPLHHYWYTPQLIAPWGVGVAERTIPKQDAVNLAYTLLFRALLVHSTPKYLVEQNSLADKVESALSSKTERPIVYKVGSRPPVRIPGPPPDPTATMFVMQTDSWIDSELNMSPIQAGITSKRGEQVGTVRLKLEQADTVLDAITRFDEETDNELLTGTLFDIARTESLGSLRNRLSNRFPDNYIAALKAQDVGDTLIGVRVTPDSLRPETPNETREAYYRDVAAGIVSADTARMAQYLRNGVVTDPVEARALDKQRGEIGQMLAGNWIEPEWDQHHAAHLYVLALLKESAEWETFSDGQQRMLDQHAQKHWALRQARMQVEAQGGQESQQSPGPPEEGPGEIEIAPPAPGGEKAPAMPMAMAGQTGLTAAPLPPAPQAGQQAAEPAMAP